MTTYYYTQQGERSDEFDLVTKDPTGHVLTHGNVVAVAPEGLTEEAMWRLAEHGDVPERVMVAQQPNLPKFLAEMVGMDDSLDVLYHLGSQTWLSLSYVHWMNRNAAFKDLLRLVQEVDALPEDARKKWYASRHYFEAMLVTAAATSTSDRVLDALRHGNANPFVREKAWLNYFARQTTN